MNLIEHALPQFAAKKPPAKKPPPKTGDGKGKGKGIDGPVRTQMQGEKPGDDLGYDPKIIPVEEIE